MVLCIQQGDVLDAATDGIVLTLDGAGPGMEGNIARAFARRWPQAWHEVLDELRYPIPLGGVVEVEIDPALDCRFRVVILASTLHHRETLSDGAKKGVVRQALQRAMEVALRYRMTSLASGIMVGGWRLSPEAAFLAMMEAYESQSASITNGLDMEIHILNESDYQIAEVLARTLGWHMVPYARGVKLS